MSDGVVKDYSHRKLLWLLDWFFANHPQVRRRNFGVRGASMGGTGAMCFGLRHPRRIAYIDASVPAADLAKLPSAKVSLSQIWGPLDQPIRAETGRTIWEEVSNTRYVQETKSDVPFIRMAHGRVDGWMTWQNTLPLYKALTASRHGFLAAWTPAGHGASRFCTAKFLNYPLFERMRIDRSFLAITDSSSDESYGNGDKTDGDLYGHMNLYIDWEVEKDTPDEYAARLRSNKGDGATLTVTPRRLQQFRVKPGDVVAYRLAAVHNDATMKEGTVTVDAEGRITLRDLGTFHGWWARLVLRRTPPGREGSRAPSKPGP